MRSALLASSLLAVSVLGSISFAQGHTTSPKPTSVRGVKMVIEKGGEIVRLTKMTLLTEGAAITADEAVWHKATNELELLGNVRVKLEAGAPLPGGR